MAAAAILNFIYRLQFVYCCTYLHENRALHARHAPLCQILNTPLNIYALGKIIRTCIVCLLMLRGHWL